MKPHPGVNLINEALRHCRIGKVTKKVCHPPGPFVSYLEELGRRHAPLTVKEWNGNV